MLKPINILLLLLFFACKPRETETAVAHVHHARDRRYYEFSDTTNLRQDSAETSHDFHDAAVRLADIGKHFEAIKIYDAGSGSHRQEGAGIDTSLYRAVPAIDHIVSEAAKNQVVMINEEHHVSTHRFFTMQLLRGLYKAGYRHFGAETINVWDTTLNERKYPTLETGYYTAEPQYGNLVREALQIGFSVFAYEASGGKNGRPREMEQARNIERIIKDDSTAKILIHCGYGHNEEGDIPEWGKAMAGWFREYTGIDPLTVDQVELSEHSAPEFESPYYQRLRYDDFVVVLQKNNVFPPNLNGSKRDVFVYHPRTKLKHNRPDWLFPYYQPVFLNSQVRISFPVIVKAYLAGEESTAVPADVIELSGREDSTALALKANNSYRIELINKQHKSQVIEVKGNVLVR